MATIKNVVITRNAGVRPKGNECILGHVWFVKKGQPFDLVKFQINELKKPYYWNDFLCFSCGMSEKQIKKETEKFAQNIEQKEIDDYLYFIMDSEEWGWE